MRDAGCGIGDILIWNMIRKPEWNNVWIKKVFCFRINIFCNFIAS
jgi:hypothetical protein